MRKNKNKLSLMLILICILAFSLTAYAKNEAVTINGAEATTSSVTVSGSTKALAVMVQVRDAEDNIIKMESFGTLDGSFSGTIDELTLKEDTEYTIYVADYEGGDWTTQTVKVSKKTEPSTEATTESTETTTTSTEATTNANTDSKTNAKAPQTGDNAMISIIVMLMLVSGSGILYLKSKNI